MGLTDLSVRKLAPKSRRYEIQDTDNLYLRVYPSGKKTWILRYFFDGEDRRLVLGRYPSTPMVDAHKLAADAMHKVDRGIDPGAEMREAKAKRKAAPTVADMLDEFWSRELSKKRSGPQTKGLLDRDVKPAWGKRKVAEVKRRDIVLLLDEIEKRSPIVRNRVHGALSRFFNFCAERGVVDDSPCTRIKKVQEKPRTRVLTDKELKSMWAALDLDLKASKVDIYRVTKLAIKLILLTGQRPGEVAGMTWEEIDQDAALWKVPAERMKGGEPQTVPLCPMAQEVIKAAKPFGDGTETGPVFRSSHLPKSAMTRHAITRAVNRHWKEMGAASAFTPHDLRRTVRTRLAELGVDDIVAEKVLGHKLAGMLRVYNQHPYLKEKRVALQRWENRLAQIVDERAMPDNVKQFPVGRRRV